MSDKPNAKAPTKKVKHTAKSNPGRRAGDKPAAKSEPADRSAAIAQSWTNKAVAEARAVKNKVKVGGTEYRSVLAAFTALKLPVEKHIAFRMELKAAGRKVFETDKGVKHTFTIVK